MRALNVAALVATTFREEPGLPSRVDELRFVSTGHTYVYRVAAGGSKYFVHITPHDIEVLSRIQLNLQRLEGLLDERIPRVLAFRRSSPAESPEQGWAVLVMSEIPGVELSPRSFSVAAWSSLCDLLRRIHSIPANYPPAS